jgi:hypothetical protein
MTTSSVTAVDAFRSLEGTERLHAPVQLQVKHNAAANIYLPWLDRRAEDAKQFLMQLLDNSADEFKRTAALSQEYSKARTAEPPPPTDSLDVQGGPTHEAEPHFATGILGSFPDSEASFHSHAATSLTTAPSRAPNAHTPDAVISSEWTIPSSHAFFRLVACPSIWMHCLRCCVGQPYGY